MKVRLQIFFSQNKRESIKKPIEKKSKVLELEDKSEDEYFYDRFSSIEELNEYYKQMMADKRIKSFKKQIKFKGEFQQKVNNSDYFEGDSHINRYKFLFYLDTLLKLSICKLQLQLKQISLKIK